MTTKYRIQSGKISRAVKSAGAGEPDVTALGTNQLQAWNPSPLKTAELIQADMAQVGVKVKIIPVEGRFQEARLMDMNHDLTLSGCKCAFLL